MLRAFSQHRTTIFCLFKSIKGTYFLLPMSFKLTSVTGYISEVKFDLHFKIPIPQFSILYVPLHHQIRLVNIGNVPFRFLTVFQLTSYNNYDYCIIKLRFLTSLLMQHVTEQHFAENRSQMARYTYQFLVQHLFSKPSLTW